MMHAVSKIIAVSQQDGRISRIAKLVRAIDNGLEDRRNIGRRRCDNLQHVGGRGLLLQGFLEIAGLGLHLVEQARIFDCDHGLVGEGLDQAAFPEV